MPTSGRPGAAGGAERQPTTKVSHFATLVRPTDSPGGRLGLDDARRPGTRTPVSIPPAHVQQRLDVPDEHEPCGQRAGDDARYTDARDDVEDQVDRADHRDEQEGETGLRELTGRCHDLRLAPAPEQDAVVADRRDEAGGG